jgi:hypothetical protein
MISNYVLVRINALQEELEELRQVVMQQDRQQTPTARLKGVWKGVKFSDDDFAAARQSLVKNIDSE